MKLYISLLAEGSPEIGASVGKRYLAECGWELPLSLSVSLFKRTVERYTPQSRSVLCHLYLWWLCAVCLGHSGGVGARGLVTPHASRPPRVTHHAQAQAHVRGSAGWARGEPGAAAGAAAAGAYHGLHRIQPSQAQVGPRTSERRWIVGHAPIAATVVGARPRDARFRLLLELRSEGPRMSLATVRCTSRLDTTWHLAHAAQSSRVQ